MSHTTRANTNAYAIGGPVGNMSSGLGVGRDELVMENGPVRRRIAVACARCRKRKIRCSGDPVNGSGCTNCRQAGIDPSQCQFHRVGSDNVHKVLGDITMAQSLTSMANEDVMLPVFSNDNANAVYSRPTTVHGVPQLDTKSVYPSAWTVPFQEDTSSGGTYSFDQSAPTLPHPTSIGDSGLFGPAHRWSRTLAKSLHHGSNAYVDESSYSGQPLPCAPINVQSMISSESHSPLNLTSLQLTLPERPQRPSRHADSTTTQRQLPMPQPSPAQLSRNTIDQIQDQRLRSSKPMAASTLDSKSFFCKPSESWKISGDNSSTSSENLTTNNSLTTEVPIEQPCTTGSVGDYVLTATTLEDAGMNTTTALHPPFDFATSGMFDTTNVTNPATHYSNFRETRALSTSSSQLIRQDSHSNLYSYSSARSSKRNSFGDESSTSDTLVSGQRYTPLIHTQSHELHNADSLHHASFRSREAPLYRSTASNLKDR
ncbi:hypothetical protein ACN47E_006232 [Coniothyrium glycines]